MTYKLGKHGSRLPSLLSYCPWYLCSQKCLLFSTSGRIFFSVVINDNLSDSVAVSLLSLCAAQVNYGLSAE
jgi:hypothetical protein